MALTIVNDHPFSEEEKKHLQDRCQEDLIKINSETEFPKKPKKQSKEEVLHLDKDIYDHVVSLNLEELQQELRKLHIPPKGNERELRTLLAEHLQDEKDAKH